MPRAFMPTNHNIHSLKVDAHPDNATLAKVLQLIQLNKIVRPKRVEDVRIYLAEQGQ
jgi:hypothetical protein